MIIFKSKRAEIDGEGKMKITADLTIQGVSKEVALEVQGPSAVMNDCTGNSHMGGRPRPKSTVRFWGSMALPASLATIFKLPWMLN
ncbi:MAG: YceI family protein [Acidobacteria bacterium]|nr:YceI family protein [Acidobacteriota bacterium]